MVWWSSLGRGLVSQITLWQFFLVLHIYGSFSPTFIQAVPESRSEIKRHLCQGRLQNHWFHLCGLHPWPSITRPKTCESPLKEMFMHFVRNLQGNPCWGKLSTVQGNGERLSDTYLVYTKRVTVSGESRCVIVFCINFAIKTSPPTPYPCRCPFKLKFLVQGRICDKYSTSHCNPFLRKWPFQDSHIILRPSTGFTASHHQTVIRLRVPFLGEEIG
jgi:hypothetical protein